MKKTDKNSSNETKTSWLFYFGYYILGCVLAILGGLGESAWRQSQLNDSIAITVPVIDFNIEKRWNPTLKYSYYHYNILYKYPDHQGNYHSARLILKEAIAPEDSTANFQFPYHIKQELKKPHPMLKLMQSKTDPHHIQRPGSLNDVASRPFGALLIATPFVAIPITLILLTGHFVVIELWHGNREPLVMVSWIVFFIVVIGYLFVLLIN